MRKSTSMKQLFLSHICGQWLQMDECINNDFYSAGPLHAANCIDLKYFLQANRFSERQCVISWYGESYSITLVVPTNTGGLSILPVRQKTLTELERMFQVSSHFLVPLSWSPEHTGIWPSGQQEVINVENLFGVGGLLM